MPFDPITRVPPLSPFRPPNPAPVNFYPGINNTRQSLADARALRRWGDWSILDVPPAVLWVDPFASPFVDMVVDPFAPVVIDIWA